jgi:hypothetical protein
VISRLHLQGLRAYQIKEYELGETYNMHGRDKKFIQNFGWETIGMRSLGKSGHG